MRLDPDLIRGLLLRVEGHEEPDLSQWSEEQQTYHLAHLIDGGFVRGSARKGTMGEYRGAVGVDLTWEGHEFLANARNATLWPKAKEQVAKAGGSVSLQVLGQVLSRLALNSLGF
ncbi:MAG TPA: DUF2513 domain-containing protein [Chthoniobacteraceae bacterium]|jgi:hypothetical protein|nr:DUF2513 domain-containing protein [Chthoniobacteraceae bacterium]